MIANGEIGKAKEQLLNKVKAVLRKKDDLLEKNLILDFVDVFWAQLHLDDWAAKSPSNIAGCCHSLWLSLYRNTQELNVQVFNPSLEEHAWVSSGSVIILQQFDVPFLVDSLRLELNRKNIPIHIIKSTLLSVERDEHGVCRRLQSTNQQLQQYSTATFVQEVVVIIEVGLILDSHELMQLKQSIESVLVDVNVVVSDYQPIQEKVDELSQNLSKKKGVEDVDECLEFLTWLKNSHFTFLGFQEFNLDVDSENVSLVEQKNSRLGLFRRSEREHNFLEGSGFDHQKATEAFYGSSVVVSFSKSAYRSTVHRPVYPDYIVFKRFDDNGKVLGESRILGLFTYAVYSISPQEIPILRRKVSRIIQRSGLLAASHDGKNLIRVLESFPRDEIFQSDIDSLYDTIMGVAAINERRVVKLFMRDDPFGKFVNCVAYVPRDIYSTRIRIKIEEIIGGALSSQAIDSTTHFSESILARAHMVFRLSDNNICEYDPSQLESSIIEVTKGWSDRFESALVETYGDAMGLKYYQQYSTAFSVSYQESFDAEHTITDIQMQESLQNNTDIAMQLFHPDESSSNTLRFKVMRLNESLELSDVIPILEHLGLKVLGEHPYQIRRSDGVIVWLHDFSLRLNLPIELDVQSVKTLFEDTFEAVWFNKADSDEFNCLVLGARLTWQEVVLLRAYAGYMKQTAFNFTQNYIANTLAKQLPITRNLVSLFKMYFDPKINDGSEKIQSKILDLKNTIEQSLDALDNLDEDKILRRYFDFINGTLRTNFFQSESRECENDHAISFKFSPRDIANIPEPRPLYEIYVYSPRMEGVHLRTAKVARGGLRWSDRLQDYRTEVLGLVKAQQVKNSVIVPSGAKGGFVAKYLSKYTNRDEIQAEGIACYKMFIRGLLDVTDNYINGELVSPRGVICRDTADPYLVVAADKGTATFSDIANGISKEYGHWLGDAFASGGSVGYDHKKMGITAKGAWISVQRHFRERGLDIQNQAFTVVGIGDMSGDVFGNGMLLSKQIQLVAAFNHMHIFIDPSPEVQSSFEERKRLFDMPRSGWGDYNNELISKGGGVFLRSLKSISITAEMKSVFAITQDKLAPTELISALLKSPVDLIWNGGIGTYVKSSTEIHSDVGDKANDVLRVNGSELNCKVIGEGGNLGVTQLGRIEYALKGGACNTDFIDNAAGVDCSDHEVNIKILLDEIVTSGELTHAERISMLESMTQSVADLVLMNNYRQTSALSLAQHQVSTRMGEYRRFIQFLENQGWLNRALEFLPSEEQLLDRESKSIALTRPELSVLISYSKMMLKEEFIKNNIAADSYLQKNVETAFPVELIGKYKKQVYAHRLMKEIVATQTANDLINSLGVTALYRLIGVSGNSFKNVAVAFVAAKKVFRLDEFQAYLKTLDNVVPEESQIKMMGNMMRRVRRATRWFMVRLQSGMEPIEQIDCFQKGISEINPIMGEVLQGDTSSNWSSRRDRYAQLNISTHWVMQLSMPDNLFSGLSVVEVARVTDCKIVHVAEVFYRLYDYLNLEWFATQLSEANIVNYWQAMARESFLDDLESQMRVIVSSIVVAVYRADSTRESAEYMDEWMVTKKQWVGRWMAMLDDIQQSSSTDFAMFSVAIRTLAELSLSCAMNE